MAAPSASVDRTGLSPVASFAFPPLSTPKAPKATFASERFMALHMIVVRISPDAPTKAPEMISTMLPRTNPAEDAARPE